MLESLASASSYYYYYCSTCMHTEYCLSGTELVSGNMGLRHGIVLRSLCKSSMLLNFLLCESLSSE